jgi:hypothetical protein
MEKPESFDKTGNVCTECVLDFTDPTIKFDEHGVCNYCDTWKKSKECYGVVENGKEIWEKELMPEIVKTGKNHKYNCVIGVSGGVDSTYLCYIIKQYPEIKPLLVHVGSCFDTELAKNNLKIIQEKTGYDLVVPNIAENELIALIKAYLYASVMDTDVPADYLIEACNRINAEKNHVQYLLSGGNYMADAFMPYSWTFPNKLDRYNLKQIYRKFGDGTPLKTIPKYGAKQVLWGKYIHHLKYKTPLNYFNYSRFEAFDILKKEWGYNIYGEKHGENIFTRFYQCYILPKKFWIDKRKANYSNYIRSGFMTREEALRKIKEEPIYDPEMYKSDRAFVLQKLGMDDKEFDRIMALPEVKHEVFGTDKVVYEYEEAMRKYAGRARDAWFGMRGLGSRRWK